MKQLFSWFGGGITVTEQAGDVWLNFDGQLGGGQLKGIVEGKGSIHLGTGTVGLKVAEAWVNSKLPAAAQPFAQAVEAFANQAIAQV